MKSIEELEADNLTKEQHLQEKVKVIHRHVEVLKIHEKEKQDLGIEKENLMKDIDSHKIEVKNVLNREREKESHIQNQIE